MNVIKALQTVHDVRTPHDEFIGALEYLAMYREGSFVVDYCHILGDCIYIKLDGITLFYLDMLFVA